MRHAIRRIALSFVGMGLLALSIAGSLSGQETRPDTLKVFDAAGMEPGMLPDTFRHVVPKNYPVPVSYTIERSIDGRYLRARSTGSASYIELDVGSIDVRKYPLMEWVWKVDTFPKVEWEAARPNDDFALRIELVYDYRGSRWNPIYIIRKGLFTALFTPNRPARIISYVWAVKVPPLKAYTSPEDARTTIIPIQANDMMPGRWLREQQYIAADLATFDSDATMVLKRIRIRADSENTGSSVESGLRFISLIARPGK